MGFKFYKQLDFKDCGPTCLKMVAKHYGRTIDLQFLRELCDINKDGVSLLGIQNAAEAIGLRSAGVKLDTRKIKNIPLPCILHWKQKHFVVLYKILENKYSIADPAKGKYNLTEDEFSDRWLVENDQGIILVVEPTLKFGDDVRDSATSNSSSLGVLFNYLKKYKSSFLKLFLCLGATSLLQLLAPFLTQTIVDTGINTKDIGFIKLVIASQIALLAGKATVELVRTWVLLHISVRINMTILAEFFIKLMKLPMSFFDIKMTGDILQRVNDQKRIESFLTGPALNTIFSAFNLIIFSIVLLRYSLSVFSVFFITAVAYFFWVAFFLNKRRVIDYSRFEVSAQNQSAIVQMVSGMQEIKLNNCEVKKRWDWESIQVKLFAYDIKNALLTQYQQGGGTFITESGNMVIVLICAESVVAGHLTLGAMIAIQYIIGQLAGSIQQFLVFLQTFQDAKISLERLNELRQLKDEQSLNSDKSLNIPPNKAISLQQVVFRYPGAGNAPVLQGLNLCIPAGKTTAIVGMSGSGKTTILKLLLRFYEPEKGTIFIGGRDLNNISFKLWREQCGVVMQEGFIFSDSLLRNIAVGEDVPNMEKLKKAIDIANIGDFIEGLPMGLNTQIGADGNGISQGQKQRILIARAIYKDPHYLFFDEATNALDANNENIIMGKLKDFFAGRTVIIVAHRLSTVTAADNIIVLNKGEITEQGDHEELVSQRGEYFRLVRNQLELGV